MDAAHELAGHCNLCGRGLPKLAKFCPRCGGTVHEDLSDGRRRVIARKVFSVRTEVRAPARPPPLPVRHSRAMDGCLISMFIVIAGSMLIVLFASLVVR
jgi:hypothetical protein